MATKKEMVAKEMRKAGLDPEAEVEEGIPEPKPGKKYTDSLQEMDGVKINVRTY